MGMSSSLWWQQSFVFLKMMMQNINLTLFHKLIRIIGWLRWLRGIRKPASIWVCWGLRSILRWVRCSLWGVRCSLWGVRCSLWRIGCCLRRVRRRVALSLWSWEVGVTWLGWRYGCRSRVEHPSVGESGARIARCSSLVLWGWLCLVSWIVRHSPHPHPCIVDMHIAESHRGLWALASLLFERQTDATGAACAAEQEDNQHNCSRADAYSSPRVVSVPVPSLLLLLILWSSKLPGEGVNVSAVGLLQLRLGHIILCHIDGREEGVAESFLRAHHRSVCILVCILVHHLLGLVCLGHLLQSLVDSLKDHRVRLCVVCYCAAVHIQKQLTLTRPASWKYVTPIAQCSICKDTRV